MNIPMLNEINENTNAAKNEILKAMPAAGATSAEVEAAKTAIIEAMTEGGSGNTFVPSSAEVVNASTGSSSVTAFSANGKGWTDVLIYTASRNSAQIARVTVDGVHVLNNVCLPNDFSTMVTISSTAYHGFYLRVRFNSSIVIWIDGLDSSNKTLAKGIVYFE